MRQLGFNWKYCASKLKVVPRTFFTWRENSGYVDPVECTLSDDALDALVVRFTEGHPSRGEQFVLSAFRANGMLVTRSRIRQSIQRVDPHGRAQRSQRCIKRRVYNVAGPYHLWLQDGNHKLVVFNFVIIDGFSRAIMFIHISDNNQADTVLRYYLQAVAEYGCPSRLRTY